MSNRKAAAKVEPQGEILTEARLDEAMTVPLTMEERYQAEKHNLRLKKWRESPFAVGLTEPTWADERTRTSNGYGDDELVSDDAGCLCASAYVCSALGAGRVGNMAVLSTSTETVEEVEEDEETGESEVRRYTRPRLNIVVGPYWPMMAFVTYPLILGVSSWAFYSAILPGRLPTNVVILWVLCTGGLIVALAFTACRDPGIMYKYKNPPPQHENTWRWSDQAQTYRPRGAFFDTDTAVVVEGFDHTCPWTGTAIGKNNMFPFQMFVCLVFVCMIFDIFFVLEFLVRMNWKKASTFIFRQAFFHYKDAMTPGSWMAVSIIATFAFLIKPASISISLACVL